TRRSSDLHRGFLRCPGGQVAFGAGAEGRLSKVRSMEGRDRASCHGELADCHQTGRASSRRVLPGNGGAVRRERDVGDAEAASGDPLAMSADFGSQLAIRREERIAAVVRRLLDGVEARELRPEIEEIDAYSRL